MVRQVLAALVCLAGSAAAADPALDELLKQYRKLGLPLPPNDAKLVQYDTGCAGSDKDGNRLPNYQAIAFELAPDTATKGPLLLVGIQRRQQYLKTATKGISPHPDSLKGIYGYGDGIIVALQCHSRGWESLAKAIYERSREGAETAPEMALIDLAWEYWISQIIEPKIDRAPVAKHLREIMALDDWFDTEDNQALVKSLELALVPGKGKPGSVEALIDALVDYSADTGPYGRHEPSEAYEKLAKMGFDAVPALISHLDDDRLTRAVLQAHIYDPAVFRISRVVGELLEKLACEPFERDDDRYWVLKKQTVDLWWDYARKIGEEAYLLKVVFPPMRLDGKWNNINEHVLLVLAAKYPKQLPGLYRRVLGECSDIDSFAIAQAVMKSPLPDPEKRALMLRGARHSKLAHCHVALKHLAQLDQLQFTEILTETLESLPADVQEPYWLCDEARIAALILDCDDLLIWPAFVKVLNRSSLGLRMELMHRLNNEEPSRHRRERIKLFSLYLDDTTLRDNKADKRLDGPGAGFPFDKIEMRKFAAIELAPLLGIDLPTTQVRSEAEWERIRAEIRQRLAE